MLIIINNFNNINNNYYVNIRIMNIINYKYN